MFYAGTCITVFTPPPPSFFFFSLSGAQIPPSPSRPLPKLTPATQASYF